VKQGIIHSAIPIIALTANAVVGMREMFIEKGFNDFLSKPIDVSKLDEILKHWIPKEKRKQKAEKKEKNDKLKKQEKITASNFTPIAAIPGIDIQRGIAMTGGTMELYRQVLSLFCKDTEQRLPLLQTTPDEDALTLFVTHVHALKSASASIGAAEVSGKAAELEAAGHAGDIDFIRGNLFDFSQQIAELTDKIRAWETISWGNDFSETKKNETHAEHDLEAILPLLHKLAAALKSKKMENIDQIMEELNQKSHDSKTKETLDQIADHILITEFESAAKIVEEFIA
jgi:HPt (histidine-containing phosphotransfer) domain-containing protein